MKAGPDLDAILLQCSLPLIREYIDSTINGGGFFGPREVNLDISKLTDEQVMELWKAMVMPSEEET